MKARMFVCFVALVLVGVVAIPAFGQNLFVKTLGGASIDYGHSVVEVSDGLSLPESLTVMAQVMKISSWLSLMVQAITCGQKPWGEPAMIGGTLW